MANQNEVMLKGQALADEMFTAKVIIVAFLGFNSCLPANLKNQIQELCNVLDSKIGICRNAKQVNILAAAVSPALKSVSDIVTKLDSTNENKFLIQDKIDTLDTKYGKMIEILEKSGIEELKALAKEASSNKKSKSGKLKSA